MSTDTGKIKTAPFFVCYFDSVDLSQTDQTGYFGYLALSPYFYDVDINNPLICLI